MKFETEEQAREYLKSKTAGHPNLLAWIEKKDGAWYVFFNVYD